MAKKNPPQPPTTQPKAWEAQKHPPGMQPGDFYDDFEETPGAAKPEAGKAAPDDPIHAMSAEEKKALRDKNEAAAKDFIAGRVKAEGLEKLDAAPAALPKMDEEEEASLQPKVYRVLEDYTMARPGGSNTLLRRGKLINDREYDLPTLLKQGCPLQEIAIPTTAKPAERL